MKCTKTNGDLCQLCMGHSGECGNGDMCLADRMAADCRGCNADDSFGNPENDSSETGCITEEKPDSCDDFCDKTDCLGAKRRSPRIMGCYWNNGQCTSRYYCAHKKFQGKQNKCKKAKRYSLTCFFNPADGSCSADQPENAENDCSVFQRKDKCVKVPGCMHDRFLKRCRSVDEQPECKEYLKKQHCNRNKRFGCRWRSITKKCTR